MKITESLLSKADSLLTTSVFSVRSIPQYYTAADVSQSPAIPASCREACPFVNIKCLDPEGLAYECGPTASACGDKTTCTMFEPATACQNLGLCSGAESCTMPFDSFDQAIQCQGHLDNPGEFEDCCVSVRHEMGHLCDPDQGHRCPATSGCGETFASDVATQCINATFHYYCGGTPPRWSDEQCKELCIDVVVNTIFKIWDACMCKKAVESNGQGVSGAQCCDCVKECSKLSAVDALITPKPCKQLLDQGKLEDICADLPTDGHGCDRYNPGTLPGPNCPPTSTAEPTKTPDPVTTLMVSTPVVASTVAIKY